MDQLKEDVFSQLFAAGSVKWVDVRLVSDGRAIIAYTLQNGTQGFVFTKRGQVKHYKADTALRFLRSVGLSSVKVEMAAWDLSGQRELLR